LSTYDELKSEIVYEALRFQESAKTRIPLLVEALKNENPKITNEDVKDRILKDFLQFWTRETIMNALGDDYKDKAKQEAAQKRQFVPNISRNGSQVSNFCSNDSSTEFRRNQNIVIENPARTQDILVGLEKKLQDVTAKFEATERRNIELTKQLKLKHDVKTVTEGEDVEALKSRLEAAEMEIGFLKEGLHAEELIEIKGKKSEPSNSYYATRVGANILVQRIRSFQSSGIHTWEVYMKAII